jgi:hypothetical protein
MTNEQRIKLAEFVGWRNSKGWWISPDGIKRLEAFDPRNDANDCEALIDALREKKNHGVMVNRPAGLDMKAVVHVGRLQWHGDDWKHGVCDLAEKVIDDD